MLIAVNLDMSKEDSAAEMQGARQVKGSQSQESQAANGLCPTNNSRVRPAIGFMLTIKMSVPRSLRLWLAPACVHRCGLVADCLQEEL